jgi:hypothetical protein
LEMPLACRQYRIGIQKLNDAWYLAYRCKLNQFSHEQRCK